MLGPIKQAEQGARHMEALFTVCEQLPSAIRMSSHLPRAARQTLCSVSVWRGRFSRFGWASGAGKKICHRNVATADAMGEAFLTAAEAFWSHEPSKVAQVFNGS